MAKYNYTDEFSAPTSAPIATPTDLRYAVQQLAQTDPQYAEVSMATDYSAISRLPANLFSPFMVQARVPGAGAYRGDSSVYQWNEDGTPVMQQAGNGLQMDEAAMLANPALAAYQSKFTQAEDLGDGLIRARMQQPGADKYDLMDVFYKLDPATGEYVMQGDPNTFRRQSSMTSGLQTLGKAATPILAAMGAPYLAGALGGAGAGAVIGAGGSLIGGGNTQDALRGAAIGGAMGGISDYMGNIDPLSPMEVPSAEWQNVPTGNIDAALNHVSPALDGAIGSGVQHLTPAAMESMIGTPGYGINASADAYLEGIGSPNLSGINATVPPEYLNSGNWNAQGTLPDTPVNPTQTIDVNGGAVSSGIGSVNPSYAPSAVDAYLRSGASDMSVPSGQGGYAGAIDGMPEELGFFEPSLYSAPTGPSGAAPPNETIEITGKKYPEASYSNEGVNYPAPVMPTAATDLPQADYSNEGNNYPTPESTQGPGGSPVNAGPAIPAPAGLGSKIGDFFKANPKLAISLLGSVFGGGSSGGSGSGGSGGIGSQGGMTAAQAPKFQRQYVAPPAGYRPGFDPEHKYFTGIGNVGTGG